MSVFIEGAECQVDLDFGQQLPYGDEANTRNAQPTHRIAGHRHSIYVHSMKVFLVDEDGNVIMETETDEFGNFVFKDLPTDKNYIVKVDDQNDMVLMVFNNVDHLVAMMTKGSKGTFIYRMLDTDNNVSIDLITEQEGELVFRKERMMVSGQFVFENLDGNSTKIDFDILDNDCLLYTSPSPRDRQKSRMPSSA